MQPKIPQSVSYDELLSVLQERIADGEIPEDNEYFAELLFGLCRRADLSKQLEEKRSKKRQEESAVVIDITPYLRSEGKKPSKK